MRSVVFADEKVVDLLNGKFVAAWFNLSPEWGAGGEGEKQPVFSKEELAAYPEGAGGGNIRAYVTRPDGTIVHYVEGWYQPERFRDELEFGISLLDEKDVNARQAEHAAKHREEQAAVAKAHPGEMAKPYAESKERRLHAALGLQADMHRIAAAWAGREIGKTLEEAKGQTGRRGGIQRG